jgi:hypothetical protein
LDSHDGDCTRTVLPDLISKTWDSDIKKFSETVQRAVPKEGENDSMVDDRDSDHWVGYSGIIRSD